MRSSRAIFLVLSTALSASLWAQDTPVDKSPQLVEESPQPVDKSPQLVDKSPQPSDKIPQPQEDIPQPVEDSSQGTSEGPAVAESVDLKEVVESPELEPAVDSLPSPATDEVTESKASIAAPNEEPAVTKVPEPEPEGEKNKAMVLLNKTVEPGTAARVAWKPVSAAFTGIASPTPVLVVNGAKPGPRLCLTAAVHGDELNGIEIVRHILYEIDPKTLAGSVIGVPIVNLQGFRRSSRYLSDRRDLNRYFPGRARGSAASRMAHSFFTEVVAHCDLLVDLHTGSFRRTNMPQLRADLSYPEVRDLAERMGAIVVLQSKGHPGSLRRAATEAGIPAVTMELGQPNQLQKDMIDHGKRSVNMLLDSLGMQKRLGFFAIKPEPVYYRSKWVRATNGGVLFSEVVLGERISRGAVLGVVTDPITNVRHEIKAPFAGRIIGMALNQVMYPGFAAYHIGLQSSAERAAEDTNTESAVVEDGTDEADVDPRDREDS